METHHEYVLTTKFKARLLSTNYPSLPLCLSEDTSKAKAAQSRTVFPQQLRISLPPWPRSWPYIYTSWDDWEEVVFCCIMQDCGSRGEESMWVSAEPPNGGWRMGRGVHSMENTLFHLLTTKHHAHTFLKSSFHFPNFLNTELCRGPNPVAFPFYPYIPSFWILYLLVILYHSKKAVCD